MYYGIALTPALSHPMGEGEFSDVLPERPPQFMGSKREIRFGGILSHRMEEGDHSPAEPQPKRSAGFQPALIVR